MVDSCNTYEEQFKIAKEKVFALKNELKEVKLKLKKDRKNLKLIHEFKIITIRISKAVYELEHSNLLLKSQ